MLFRSIMAMLLSGGLLVQASVSQAPGASPNALLQEFEYLSFLIRASSSCPQLIEDWEYTVLAARTDNLARDITGGRSSLSSQRRQAFSRAIGSSCDRPELASEVIKAREYARRTWLTIARAYRELKDCEGAPSAEDRLFLADFELSMIVRNNSDPDMKPLGGEDLASAAKFGLERAGVLNGACKSGANRFADIPGWGSFLAMATAPLREKQAFEALDGRKRRFDLNQGFTLGLGDTERGLYRRDTAVTAVRGPRQIDRYIESNNKLCGGVAVDQDAGYTGYVDCDVKVFVDGKMEVLVRGSEIPFEITGALIQMRDLQTGAVLREAEGSIIDPFASAAEKSAIIQFDDVVQFLAQGAGTLEQVHIAFKARREDGSDPEFELIDSNFGQRRSVAVVDFLRAAVFAFAPDDIDLTLNLQKAAAQASNAQ